MHFKIKDAKNKTRQIYIHRYSYVSNLAFNKLQSKGRYKVRAQSRTYWLPHRARRLSIIVSRFRHGAANSGALAALARSGCGYHIWSINYICTSTLHTIRSFK